MWAAPRSVGRIVTPLAAVGCLPIIIASPLVMSADVLLLLWRQHEFWFFVVTSANNWTIASILFNDARIAGCLICFAINVLAVMMDANFRTIILAARTGLAWFPAIFCIILVCALRIVDIEPGRFGAVIPTNKINFTLANWFVNINATLVIFLSKQTYHRRRVFTSAFLHDRVIPCSTIRWNLVLRRMTPNDANGVNRVNTFMSLATTDKDSEVLRRPSFLVECNSASSRVKREHGDQVDKGIWSATQTVRILTPTMAFLDLRNALMPSWMPSRRISLMKAVVLYACGIVGLFLAAFTMYLPAEQARRVVAFDDVLGFMSLPKVTLTLVPAGSLACTLGFIASFVGSYQRDVLRALLHNFDFMFTSLQFHFGCLCLADMMHWDTRCLALVAWDLWFHWILLWDALVPELRDRLHFKKVYGTPVLLCIMLGLVWIVYSLLFSSYDALDDRTLFAVQWGSFDVTIRTSTFLIGRLTTVLTWSLRLVWKALRSHEDDLIFIRGQVEYFTPMEFFPSVAVPDAPSEPPTARGLARLLRLLRTRQASVAVSPLPPASR